MDNGKNPVFSKSADEFIGRIKEDYTVIKMVSGKTESKILFLKHKNLDKKAVLKIYDKKNDIYDFLKGISFVNLPLIYDTYELDDGYAVLEQYIDGLNAAQVIESGLYTYKGAKKIISELCDALVILHRHGFIHRDVKPENVMITSNGTVKLIDFNISREYKSNKSKDTVALGTIGYASPEQIGISKTSPATDIYALGVLLNVMLTGKHPSEKLAKGKAGKIVLRCTQISPQKRFENVISLKKSL